MTLNIYIVIHIDLDIGTLCKGNVLWIIIEEYLRICFGYALDNNNVVCVPIYKI